jgi:hypothetical protein
MTNFLDPGSPGDDWPNTSITPSAIAYTCGATRRRVDPVRHRHEPDEWRRCRGPAERAAKPMEGVEVGMGSSGEPYFAPVHCVAEPGAAVPQSLSEPVVRAAFGGTISPRVGMVIGPLEERGQWWAKVRESLVENDDALEDDVPMAEGKAE